MTVRIASKAHIVETSGPGAIISQVCTWYNIEIWELGKEEAGKTGGGCIEYGKKIKRPINICQTLKCKFLVCGPVGTKSSIITFLGRA